MLNYIWAGLIVVSLAFALVSDLTDEIRDTFRNGRAVPVKLALKKPYAGQKEVPVDLVVEQGTFEDIYGTKGKVAASYAGVVTVGDGGKAQVKFAKDVALPEPWSRIRQTLQSDYDAVGELRGTVGGFSPTNGVTEITAATVVLEPVRLHRLGMVTKAALYFAKAAVNIALSLIGVMALWLGLLKIAEKSGLVDVLVWAVRPVLGPLFPEIPRDHPALGMIAINLASGMLGLGNAATPMGIKAMEELQKLNKSNDTATNPMVMLLALNTTCPQLVPGAGLLAVLGLQAGKVWLPTVISMAGAMAVAILMTRLLARLPGYWRTNPDLLPATATVTTTGAN